MAAGEGRRLRPLTEHWPKPVLPIDGKPVVGMLLRELAASGIETVTVVTGHLAEQVEQLVEAGSAYGVEVRYVRQPAPDGSADAVRRALEAGAEPPLLVSAADMLYARGDVDRFRRRFADSGAAGALAVSPSPSSARVRVEAGRIARVVDDDPANTWFASALWGLTERLTQYLEGLSGPPFELAEAYQRAADAGEEIAAIEIGFTRDLTGPLDLVKENFPYLRTT